jgi:predicted Zn finger-like uncharacterized protein
MLIACPNCATSYEVSAAALGTEGRSVRCVRCQEVWFATPTEAPASTGAAAAMADAAAASARYQQRSTANVGEPEPDAAFDGAAADDHSGFEIDANLAARAADRSAAFEHSPEHAPMIDAAGAASGMDGNGPLAAHDAPPLAPGSDAAASEDIESSAARRARHEALTSGRRRRRPSFATIILSLLAVNMAILGWRSDVVRLMPQTGSLFAAIGLPVNLRGLAILDVTTAREAHDGVSVLLVRGRIANVSRQPRDVPRIRFAMRDQAGTEVYSWTSLPERSALAPGDAEPFQTRLASPPASGHEVVVRFFTRRDLVGGQH